MPIPVPDEVTEEWLIPKEFLDHIIHKPQYQYYQRDTFGNPQRIYYRDIPVAVRDKSARTLYATLTQQQVDQLRQHGNFMVNGVRVFVGSKTRITGLDHPSVLLPRELSERCVAFGTYHDLLPVCDRLLSIKLAIETRTLALLGGDF